MKKILIGGVVVIVVLAGVAFFTLSNLGPIVKKTINTVGPEITKTQVSVNDVGISVFSGQAKIKGFLLGNPKGFQSANAMTVGSVYVDIDEKSITKDTIIINRIEVAGPEITLEKISGSDNFKAILSNVQKTAGSGESSKKESASKGDSRKIIINDLIVKNGKINLSMAALAGKKITAPLPDIHLKDIGKEKNGATPAEAFEKIFNSLYSSISADSVTQVFNDSLKKLGNIKDLGATGLKSGEETAQKAVESASKGVESAAKGLKSMFNKQ